MSVPTSEPIRGGLHRVIGVTCSCGGELRVERLKADGTTVSNDPDFRWETFCTRCKSCDCNGWRTLALALANAAEYFGKVSEP